MMSEEIQKINLNDYIQTGEGGTALTYTHKNGRSLAKLYLSGTCRCYGPCATICPRIGSSTYSILHTI